MCRVVSLKYKDEYKIELTFSDGICTIMDFYPFIGDGISAKLLDKEYFHQAKIDEYGNITWANGYDFCPFFLKEVANNAEDNNTVNI